MTSRDFYQTVDRVLRPALAGQGFTRLKTTSSTWVKPLLDRFVMLQVKKNLKHPFIKPIGGKFNVWFYLANKATVSAAHGETSISFLRYQTDSDLAELKRLRQKVLQKILTQTEFESDFDKSLLELNRPVIQLSMDHNFNRRQPWPLEYLDTEDVAALVGFIAKIVSAAFDGIAREGELALGYK